VHSENATVRPIYMMWHRGTAQAQGSQITS